MADWTNLRPQIEGVYRVRGWHIGSARDEAVVEVTRHRGVWVCNLHRENSDRDKSEWSRLDEYSARFEWQLIEVAP